MEVNDVRNIIEVWADRARMVGSRPCWVRDLVYMALDKRRVVLSNNGTTGDGRYQILFDHIFLYSLFYATTSVLCLQIGETNESVIYIVPASS